MKVTFCNARWAEQPSAFQRLAVVFRDATISITEDTETTAFHCYPRRKNLHFEWADTAPSDTLPALIQVLDDCGVEYDSYS